MAKSKPKSKTSASAKMSAATKKKISASQKKRLATLKRKKEEAARAKEAEQHRLDAGSAPLLGAQEPQPMGEILLSFRPRRFLDAHLEHLTDLGNQVNEIEAQLEAFLKRAGVSHGGNDGKFASIIESQNAMDQVAAVTNLLQRQINRLGENVFRLSQII